MAKTFLAFVALGSALFAQPYDLLLKGGHVIDPRNNVNQVMDVAVANGKVARVASAIPPSEAKRVADVSGLYVTPGLIDIHVHVFSGGHTTGVIAGDHSVPPDAFSFRSGVTTMVDAGSSGWRNFPDFRERIIRNAKTRVLAFLNIAGGGMGNNDENDPRDMDPEAAARMAGLNPDIIVGFKTAHYKGPGWPSVENAVKAGKAADLPVMVDFGYIDGERNIRSLFMEKLRPGDIFTHCYSGHREELLENGRLNPAMWEGRKRGILFDVGHGAGSFYWYVAVPAFQQKFYPDTISTDLHTGSMNAGMKDFANVMSKVLNLGVPLEQVVEMSTWAAARTIKRPELGRLDTGAEADITVLRLNQGSFGLIDAAGAHNAGDRFLVAEITIRKGQVVWDLNGRAAPDWKTFRYRKRGS